MTYERLGGFTRRTTLIGTDVDILTTQAYSTPKHLQNRRRPPPPATDASRHCQLDHTTSQLNLLPLQPAASTLQTCGCAVPLSFVHPLFSLFFNSRRSSASDDGCSRKATHQQQELQNDRITKQRQMLDPLPRFFQRRRLRQQLRRVIGRSAPWRHVIIKILTSQPRCLRTSYTPACYRYLRFHLRLLPVLLKCHVLLSYFTRQCPSLA